MAGQEGSWGCAGLLRPVDQNWTLLRKRRNHMLSFRVKGSSQAGEPHPLPQAVLTASPQSSSLSSQLHPAAWTSQIYALANQLFKKNEVA